MKLSVASKPGPRHPRLKHSRFMKSRRHVVSLYKDAMRIIAYRFVTGGDRLSPGETDRVPWRCRRITSEIVDEEKARFGPQKCPGRCARLAVPLGRIEAGR